MDLGGSSTTGLPAGSRLVQYLHGGQGSARGGSTPTHQPQTTTMSPNVPTFIPFSQMNINGDKHASFHPHRQYPSSSLASASLSSSQLSNDMNDSSFVQENLGGTTYFYPPTAGGSPMLDGGLPPGEREDPVHTMVTTNGCFAYHGPPAHVGKFVSKRGTGQQFVSSELKMELLNRQLAMECRADPAVYPDLPTSVEHFQQPVPLEPPSRGSSLGGHVCTVYKAVSVKDGNVYVLRRIHNYRLANIKQLQPAETWKKLTHINVAQLREVIPATRAFNDTSLLFVYDYHPLAESLRTRHFDRRTGSFLDQMNGKPGPGGPPGSNGAGLAEALLWNYIIQLTSALRAIHANGLAARCVDLSKILVVGKAKLVLSACGLLDVLTPEHVPMQQQQNEDLFALGRVIVALATGNVAASRRDLITQSLQHVGQHYSADMKNLITFLLVTNQQGRRSINEIMPMIGARFYAQLEQLQVRNDILETELTKELENGRLFRLLCKLNTVVERPEFNMDPQWSETGDRFLLKLFRDYLFHQVMENGKPWLDMAHIIQCLNKLDAGVNEKIQLVSRDGENVLVVAYADLRRCVETAFRELQGGGGRVH